MGRKTAKHNVKGIITNSRIQTATGIFPVASVAIQSETVLIKCPQEQWGEISIDSGNIGARMIVKCLV